MAIDIRKLLTPPFDDSELFKNLKFLDKELSKKKEQKTSKKIAILGGSTTAHLKELLNIFLLNNDFIAEFYEGQFQLFYEEVVFNVGKLKEFNPDIIWIHTSWRNIKKFPHINNSTNEINLLIENEFEFYKSIWDYANKNLTCTVIQNNFDYPNFRTLANKDSVVVHGKINFLSELNRKLNVYDSQNAWFNIFDINYLSFLNGSVKWQNERDWYKYRYTPSLSASVDVAYGLSKIILALQGLSNKCLIVDLDNTIWGGVIGDDGIENIKLGRDSPIGDAHLDFQSYILELKNRGIILAVVSKNEDKIARIGLSHPNSILKNEDFSAFVANWNSKSSNIKEIINQINIGESSAIFIDDNAMERDEVKLNTGLIVPDIGENIENFRMIIDKNNFFELTEITKEDLSRPDSIRISIQSEKTLENFKDYNEYLKSLEMKSEIKRVDEKTKDRFIQLINKTNQFNMTLKKINLNNFSTITDKNKSLALTASLKDKFIDHGIVSTIYGEIVNGNEIDIKVWVMSCRVFKRTLEFSLFNEFLKFCKDLKIIKINGFYEKNDRNIVVKNLYKELGFQMIKINKGSSNWSLEINKNLDIPKSMVKINYE